MRASKTQPLRKTYGRPLAILAGSAITLAMLALIASQQIRINNLEAAGEQPEITPGPALQTAQATVNHQDAPFSTQGLIVTLAPGQGAELLASMEAGDAFVFAWITRGGPVSVDLHGIEHGHQSDAFASYHKAESALEGFGHFVAPFAGTHGWHWRNDGEAAVTVSITVSGYFEEMFVEDSEDSDGPVPHSLPTKRCCPALAVKRVPAFSGVPLALTGGVLALMVPEVPFFDLRQDDHAAASGTATARASHAT
jgi:hypothetical protein